jgi:DNA repair protein RadC
MAIKEWPAPERPRERLLALGPAALTDAELLALLLRHGTPGRDAVGLARELLACTRGLRRLVELPLPAFTALPGLGSARYAELQAALELSRRYLREGLERPARSVVRTVRRTTCSPSSSPCSGKSLAACSSTPGIS